MADTFLTENILVDIEDPCPNGVFLRWINDMGGVDSWYFTGNIAQLPQVDNTNYFLNFIDDLLNETSNFEIISKEYKENLRVYAIFKKENAEGFKQLIRSKSIEMLVGSTYFNVDVVLESFTVERHSNMGKIAIQIVLPQKNLK